ncbi:unnamed protein product [Orchesella dallaii]|uniref:Uncharacterized protein n=1 Tax=Orchesella dallaii TaxID=48710 RepID=A0ABP1RWE6_9HEXA
MNNTNLIFFCHFKDKNATLFTHVNTGHHQLVTISPNKTAMVEEYITRFSNPTNIILNQLQTQNNYNLVIFYKLGMRPDTVFLLFVDCSRIITSNCTVPNDISYIRKFPALKIYIFPSPLERIVASIETVEYFPYNLQLFSSFLKEGLLENPSVFHKLHFWNGNQIQIDCGAHPRYPIYFKNYPDRYSCSKMALNAKFNESFICTYDILTTIYLAEVHNLSLTIIDPGNPTESIKLKQHFTFQFVIQSANYVGSHNLPYFYETGFDVSYYQSQQLIYCSRIVYRRFSIQYSMWIQPFSLVTWTFVFGSISLGSFVLIRGGKGGGIWVKIHAIVALFTGHDVPVGKRSGKGFIVLLFSAMLITSLYSNEITSYLVVPPPETIYRNLKQILGARFQILFQKWNNDIDPRDIYESDFKRSGMFHKINESFHIANNVVENTVSAKYLSMIDKKYAALVDESIAEQMAHTFHRIILKLFNFPNAKCRIVDEKLRTAPMLRVFYTVNRKWLMVTLQRMKSGGLDKAWAAWTKWYFYWQEQKYVNSNGRGIKSTALILFPNILPILLGWIIMVLVAFCLVLYERRCSSVT